MFDDDFSLDDNNPGLLETLQHKNIIPEVIHKATAGKPEDQVQTSFE